MDETPSSLTPPPAATAPTTLPARLLNVFAVPGDVFSEIRPLPHNFLHWLIPVLLAAVVGVISTMIIFAQPAIVQRVREAQDKAIQQQVDKNKMSQAQADQATAFMEKWGPWMMKVGGTVAAVFAAVARVFWWGLILWAMGRWLLKAPFPYLKGVEVAGLASLVTVLGALVTLLLTVNLSRLIATPSLALAVADFDMSKKSHLVLGAVNVFNIWFAVVVAVGLARLANAPFLRAALLVLGWMVLTDALFILSGLGQFAL